MEERSGVVGNWVVTVFLFLQFLSRLTERFVLGVDMFVETLWKLWTELLHVLGLDGRCGGGIHVTSFYFGGSQRVELVLTVIPGKVGGGLGTTRALPMGWEVRPSL